MTIMGHHLNKLEIPIWAQIFYNFDYVNARIKQNNFKKLI